MGIFDIMDKLKAEDVPVKTIPEQEQVQLYLSKQKGMVTFDKISKDTKITKERLLEINDEMSIHFRDNLASKVLFKSMWGKSDKAEFKVFFQRVDVDLCLLIMSKVKEVYDGMKLKHTPQWDFLMDNWKRYRGY